MRRFIIQIYMGVSLKVNARAVAVKEFPLR